MSKYGYDKNTNVIEKLIITNTENNNTINITQDENLQNNMDTTVNENNTNDVNLICVLNKLLEKKNSRKRL